METSSVMINGEKYVLEKEALNAGIHAKKDHPYTLGSLLCVRTVTMIQTGRLVAVYDQELVLDDAAWIADTGRFNEFLRGECVNEVEPFNGAVIVNRGAIIDVCKIAKLFTEVK